MFMHYKVEEHIISSTVSGEIKKILGDVDLENCVGLRFYTADLTQKCFWHSRFKTGLDV